MEKVNFPTASLVCQGFAGQGGVTAAGLGMPNLPIAKYPGHVNVHSVAERQKHVIETLLDQVIACLTVQPPEPQLLRSEPASGDIVFTGSFEEVNTFFYDREWSDGLPIVPPTREKVDSFLRYTDRSADEVLGVLLPDRREATVWNTAVNGVMAGCRPEYMPVLISIVEAMADPGFGQRHLGHTPGTEAIITINGPIIKDLKFNCGQGALRVGFQANTSIGRFWRLYLRNVAGFLPHKTDKASFGGTWRVVLAENEDAVAKLGWQPMSVDQGFSAGDNVVTVNSCTSTDSVFSIGAETAEEILNKLATRIVDIHLILFRNLYSGTGVRPQILISPCVAEKIVDSGYSKERMKQYLFQQARFPAKRFEQIRPDIGSLCSAASQGRVPACYCESTDPDRLVPLVLSPDDFMITVSGDPERDNCFICGQNGFIGFPVSKKVRLPTHWTELLKEAQSH